MSKVLTFTSLIEAGVVNRNDSIGNVSSIKKITTHKGTKAFFSDKAFKRAIWDRASEMWAEKWKNSATSDVGGVVQKISTIIDSEEFDFSGTMIAKPIPINRERVLVTTYGISVNNYTGYVEFLTNMGLTKGMKDNKTSIYNREHFYGMYKISGLIDINKLGEQEILIPSNINEELFELTEDMSNNEFLDKLYEFLFEETENEEASIYSKEEFINTVSELISSEIEIKSKKGGYHVAFVVDDAILDSSLSNSSDNLFPKRDKKHFKDKKFVAGLFAQLFTRNLLVEETEAELSKTIVKNLAAKLEQIISNFNPSDNLLELSLKKSDKKKTVKNKIDEKEIPFDGTIEEKIKWLYRILRHFIKFPEHEDKIASLYKDRVALFDISRDKNDYKIKISLKAEEKFRRIEMLFDVLCNLYRKIEGRLENLSPDFSIWSTELQYPVFHNYIDDLILSFTPLTIDEQKINKISNGKKVYYGFTPLEFKNELMAEVKQIIELNQRR